jgi:hypothetical protein
MAELFLAGHGLAPDALGAYLRDALPDDWIVVAEPVVARRALAALVIGPGGLVAIDVTADLRPGATVAVVCAFLAEEFPALRLPVRHFFAAASGPRVTSWASGDLPAWRVAGSDGAAELPLAEAILAAPDPLRLQAIVPLADTALRHAVAVAFRDRQIMPSQRTARPFVFRSGRAFLGGVRQSWTIRDAIRHIDECPADGVYHLRNRTLEQWLAAEGAAHLAALARDAADRCCDDPRRSLEEFLIGTGLVNRPAPIVQPRRLDLGYILAGESVTGHFSVSKGGATGYLLGHLTVSDPCLRVSPASLSGARTHVAVTVDTADLLIQVGPCEAVVAVHSPAQSEPQAVPVRFRVAPLPSFFSRYIGRPLIGVLAGALLGALIGGAWWLNAAPEFIAADRLLIGSPLFWLALFSLLWASMGAFRGLLQPAAWPASYALMRWLYSIMIWSGALGVFGATGVWLWYRGFLGDAGFRPDTMWIALHYGVALSIVPATVAELLAAQRRSDLPMPRSQRQIGRRLTWAIASAGLLLTLAVAPAFVRPVWERALQGGTWSALERRAEAGWVEAAEEVNALVRQLYLLVYDRRAPATTGGRR